MIKLADIFQDNIVLQREKPVNIFGVSDAEQTLTAFINGNKIAESKIKAGYFTFILPPQPAAEDVQLKIVSSLGDETVLENADIGEIWLAGGQSNMEFLMKYEELYDSEIKVCNDEHLRFYNVPQYSFDGEEKEGFKDNNGYNKWHCANAESLWCFSAAGYFHAKKLRSELGCPVAILGCNWGGTSATAWMDFDTIKNDEDISVYCDDYEKQVNSSTDYAKKEYRNRRVSNTKIARWANDMILYGYGDTLRVKSACNFINSFRPKNIGLGWQNANRPGGLYETMMKKIIGYTVRGVIWYQGESDEHHYELYAKLFSKMIECWRRYWQDDFPFIFVQLAPFAGGGHYPELRRHQEFVSETVPNTYMISITDAGMAKDIHPKNKHDVGYRLALKALGKIYGMDIACDAPYADTAEINGNDVILHFADCRRLKIKGNGFDTLQLISENGKVKIKSAFIKGNTLTLKTDDAGDMQSLVVHFADSPYHEVNIYNEADLPAKPFIIRIK